MPLPRLIHPVAVEVEPLARTDTIVDEDFREPIQQGSRPVRYVVPGQIKWTSDDRTQATNLGAESESEGYVLFRFVDLRAAIADGVPLNRIEQGDRFVAFGTGPNQQSVDVYVVRVQQMGHYPDQAGPALVRAWFRDRFPSKQSRGGA